MRRVNQTVRRTAEGIRQLLPILAVAVLLIMTEAGNRSVHGDERPVWGYRGIVPGTTPESALLADQNWGPPAAQRRIPGQLQIYEYTIAKSRVKVCLMEGIVRTIDFEVDAALDEVMRAFKLTDPLEAGPLPDAAKAGDVIAEAWQPRQFGCGRVVVFVGSDNKAHLIRFFGPDFTAGELRNSIGMVLKLIPAGSFRMGTLEDTTKLEAEFGLPRGRLASERPVHTVQITRPFYLGAHEVTIGQFREFVNASGYRVQSAKSTTLGPQSEQFRVIGKSWDKPNFPQEATHPVVYISWQDAVEFCKWLSRKEGRSYRLPREAEWEYACRAGSSNRFFNGNDEQSLVQVANVLDASAKAANPAWKTTIRSDDGFAYTSPVGSLKPNAFGLYDTHGNVWEWCADWYDATYYSKSPAKDPPGPERGNLRVVRGGCWYCPTAFQRSTARGNSIPGEGAANIGFRVLLEIQTD